ncbi:hypothetical protein SK854_13810 [Lentzea sp. BCCO 10_0061]|uniref:Four-helix bundle copper-binding protein n=1 Tax=Lentzea sokolovensis TaxID=3095429 RepID=A0ABU4UUK7_9PSEU|nr:MULTISPECIES: hypothetical protein [Lentzea]MDX8143198.1 hypothetical protein [Lentzea sp. BCCO 10_0061]
MNQQALARCIEAHICDTTGRVLSRHTGYNANLTCAVLEACTSACKACGDECKRCQVYAESCRRCAQACRELLDALG